VILQVRSRLGHLQRRYQEKGEATEQRPRRKEKIQRIHKTQVNEATHENVNQRYMVSKADPSNHAIHEVEPDAKPQDTDHQHRSPIK
jgi:hypothetical protein